MGRRGPSDGKEGTEGADSDEEEGDSGGKEGIVMGRRGQRWEGEDSDG